jgi:hypothetical protein
MDLQHVFAMSFLWAAPAKPVALGPRQAGEGSARPFLLETEVNLNKIATTWIREKYLVKRGAQYEKPPGEPAVNIRAFAAENEAAIASCVEGAKVWLDRIDVVPSQKGGFVARIHAFMTRGSTTSSMFETNSQGAPKQSTMRIYQLTGIQLAPYKVKLVKEKNEYEVRAYRIMAKIRAILERWAEKKNYLVRSEIKQARNRVDVVHTLSATFVKTDPRSLGRQAADENAHEFSYIARPGDKVWISGVNFYVNKKESKGTAWAATKASALMELSGHFVRCEQSGPCSEITKETRDEIFPQSQFLQIFPGPLTGLYPNADKNEPEDEDGEGGGAVETAADEEMAAADQAPRGGELDEDVELPEQEDEGQGNHYFNQSPGHEQRYQDEGEETAASVAPAGEKSPAPVSPAGEDFPALVAPAGEESPAPVAPAGEDFHAFVAPEIEEENEDDRAVAKAWFKAVDMNILPLKKRPF